MGLPDNVEQLKSQADAGAKYIELQRVEVTRLATLAELGVEDGTLDPVVAGTITDADYDKLVQLKSYYEKKVAEKFPNGRSSLEDSTKVENAGGVNADTDTADLPEVGLL